MRRHGQGPGFKSTSSSFQQRSRMPKKADQPPSRPSAPALIRPAAPCAPANRRRPPRRRRIGAPINRASAIGDIRFSICPLGARSPPTINWARPCRARRQALPGSRPRKSRAGRGPAAARRGSSCAEPTWEDIPGVTHPRTCRCAPIASLRLLHVHRSDPRLDRAVQHHTRDATMCWRPSERTSSALEFRNVSNSASTAWAMTRRAPARRISVSGSSLAPFCRRETTSIRPWRNAPSGKWGRLQHQPRYAAFLIPSPSLPHSS